MNWIEFLSCTSYSCGSDEIVDPPFTRAPLIRDGKHSTYGELVGEAMRLHRRMVEEVQQHWDVKFHERYRAGAPSVARMETAHNRRDAIKAPTNVDGFNLSLQEAMERMNGYKEEDFINHMWETFPKWFQQLRPQYTTRAALALYHLPSEEKSVKFSQIRDFISPAISATIVLPDRELEWG